MGRGPEYADGEIVKKSGFAIALLICLPGRSVEQRNFSYSREKLYLFLDVLL